MFIWPRDDTHQIIDLSLLIHHRYSQGHWISPSQPVTGRNESAPRPRSGCIHPSYRRHAERLSNVWLSDQFHIHFLALISLFFISFHTCPHARFILLKANLDLMSGVSLQVIQIIASLTCLSIANLCRILSSGAILVSYSPKRLSINLLDLFFCLYSFRRVSFL